MTTRQRYVPALSVVVSMVHRLDPVYAIRSSTIRERPVAS